MENKEIKLNLGCGMKFLGDYINVDVVRPAGELPANVPFVQDDIRSLETFKENSVDEMVAFHLVEHIPVYDIEPTLIRWHDVLKPGGRVVVELPCLVKSCINTLQMITTREASLHYNLGMYGLYGQPDPKNPYMEHKWGWTFETLSQQFRNAGFVNIQEQIPMMHQGPKRDFRLYAEKQKDE